MSLVIAVPELITESATRLGTIGSALEEAHKMTAASTLAVPPAAADEVSEAIARLFSGYGEEYQERASQAAVYHEQFVQQLTASAEMYVSAEAVNVASLQSPFQIAQTVIAATGLAELVDRIGYSILDALFITIESIESILGALGLGLALLVAVIFSLLAIALFLSILGLVGLFLIQEFSRFGISIETFFPILSLVRS